MAFSGNNQTLFNACFEGFYAGQQAGAVSVGNVSADYTELANVALAVAQEVDAGITADATLTAAGATVVPASAANQQNALAKHELMFAIAFGQAYGRANPNGSVTPASYSAIATNIQAAYAAGVTAYASAPGGTSLS